VGNAGSIISGFAMLEHASTDFVKSPEVFVLSFCNAKTWNRHLRQSCGS